MTVPILFHAFFGRQKLLSRQFLSACRQLHIHSLDNDKKRTELQLLIEYIGADVVIEIPEKGLATQNGKFNQGGEMEIF